MRELHQRAVEPARLLRVELPGGLEQEHLDQAEDGHPSEVAEDADARRSRLLGIAHLGRLELLVELARDGSVAVEPGCGEEGESSAVDQVAAEREIEDAGGGLLLVGAAASAARDDAVDGQSGKEEVPGRLRDRAAAFRETLRILALVVAVEESRASRQSA